MMRKRRDALVEALDLGLHDNIVRVLRQQNEMASFLFIYYVFKKNRLNSY
jgi:hypothetical protein